jgi:hypothetical protein
MAGLVPAIHGFLHRDREVERTGPRPRDVIAGLDPAIHAMTMPFAPRGDLTRSPLRLRRLF